MLYRSGIKIYFLLSWPKCLPNREKFCSARKRNRGNIGCVLSYFEGRANLHCYTSCTRTTLHCSNVSFLQCCHMKIYNQIFTKMWGVYSFFPNILQISCFVFRRKKCIQDWYNLRASKWWRNFHFWVNCPFNYLFPNNVFNSAVKYFRTTLSLSRSP